MTGYESLARVRDVGPNVPEELGLTLGQRVVATYGHRSAACLSAATLIPVPNDIPDEIALLIILSNDVRKGIEKLRLIPSAQILVTGSGAIGLLTLHWLQVSGFSHVDIVEPLEERRALALVLGARAAFSPAELPSDTCYEAGIECSSRQAAFALLQRHLK